MCRQLIGAIATRAAKVLRLFNRHDGAAGQIGSERDLTLLTTYGDDGASKFGLPEVHYV